MKTVRRILWGTALVLLGVIWMLDLAGVISFELFFKGWWTLFIIIPCLIGIVTEKDKLGNVFGLLIGVGLLLAARGIITYTVLWKLFLPAIVILIGLRLIFGGLFSAKGRKASKKAEERLREKLGAVNGEIPEYCATFSGMKLEFDGREFYGATLTAVFGSIDLDLRGAILTVDPVLTVSPVFGGIRILLPENVSVSVNVTGIFGGCDLADHLKMKKDGEGTVVYVNGSAVFGGVEIK